MKNVQMRELFKNLFVLQFGWASQRHSAMLLALSNLERVGRGCLSVLMAGSKCLAAATLVIAFVLSITLMCDNLR